jgi:AcrR family transcriptional regulator
VREVVALAGVSRPVFYEHFPDREHCLRAALGAIRAELLSDIRRAVAHVPPVQATAAAVSRLVGFAQRQPDLARLVLSDPLSGGALLLDARDQFLADAASTLSDAVARAPSASPTADLPTRLLLGVTCRLLAGRLRHGRPVSRGMAEELASWLATYELPAGGRCLTPVRVPSRSPYLTPTALRPPPPLRRTRARSDDEAIAENQWSRLVFATAEVVARDGYPAATVSEIIRLAGVERRTFYRLFPCKEQALGAAREMFFRHLMAVTAGAFVAGDDWAEKIWEAVRALTQCVEQNPTLAHVSLVESHTGGAVAMGRLDELIGAFTIFLQEGVRYQGDGVARSRAAPSEFEQQAIVTAVFELCHLYARAPAVHSLPGLLGHISFVCLAPFLGARQASAFLRQADARERAPHPRCAGSTRAESQPVLRLVG